MSNSIGTSEDTLILDIHCKLDILFVIDLLNTHFSDKPKFTHTPTDISGDEGEIVVLICLADGNPPPSYKWFKRKDLSFKRKTEIGKVNEDFPNGRKK